MSLYRLNKGTVKKNVIWLISDLRYTINHIIYINAYLHYILVVWCTPKIHVYLELQNVTIFGNRLFADIKLWRDHIRLQWTLNPMTGILIRRPYKDGDRGWTDVSTSRAWCVLSRFSRVWLLGTLWAAAHQAPLSMGFFRQEYWSGLPCPPPGDLPDSGIEPPSHISCTGRWFFTTGATWEAQSESCVHLFTTWAILQARKLEWVAIPFYRGSSQPRDQTLVSSIAGRLFTIWDTREAPRILG